jgi:replicative DNA helicase
MQLEKTILTNLIHNESFARKVLPFLKSEYFAAHDKIVYETINEFILKFNDLPTVSILELEADKKQMSADEAKAVGTLISSLSQSEKVNDDWLLETTEKFCKEKAIYHALMQSIEIMNGQSKVHDRGMIPSLLTDALAISFDPNVGHDYFGQAKERFAYYHRSEEKIPFDLEMFNKITLNGVGRKTLNIVMAPTGVGKSLFMCHVAAAAVKDGKNVLYITLELSEKEVGRRIDANLLDLTFKELMEIPEDLYEKRIASLRSKTDGEFVIKEYPTAAANSNHFRATLNELMLKKSFKPDIIIVDYLNICASSRMKPGGSVNSYTFVKAIAEEIRGLMVEHDAAGWSATQTNRQGYQNSDVDLDNTAESFGLPATADFMFALITSDELAQLNQLMVKQLKSRYNDININKRFVIGVDKMKMKLYDVAESAQEDIIDSGDEETVTKKDKFKRLKV